MPPRWTAADHRKIAAAVGVTPRSVARVRSQFVGYGLTTTLHRKPRADRRVPKLDGAGEARLTALACSEPPPGHARWTLRLLADQLVHLEVVESICRETVRTALEKNCLKPWLVKRWCLPPAQNAAFAAAMEDILSVYAAPPDPARPLVCFDEGGKQLGGTNDRRGLRELGTAGARTTPMCATGRRICFWPVLRTSAGVRSGVPHSGRPPTLPRPSAG